MIAKGLLELQEVTKPFFVWFEANWQHDDILHRHEKAQLIYVESGFQYLTVDGKIYLLPQNYAAWIPPNAVHKTNTQSSVIKLVTIYCNVDKDEPFYHRVNIFSVTPLLREMIRYAEKWSKNKKELEDETVFLYALYNELPRFAAQSLNLHMTLPKDVRLLKAMSYLHENYTKEFRMEILGSLSALSLRTLERIFKQDTGLTLSRYQQILRIIKSLELLSSEKGTISEIALKVGYRSLQAFTKSFFTIMHCRPSEFIKMTNQ